MKILSTWQKTAESPPQFPPLDKDVVADIVIIGAGITGLTLAHLVSKSGRKVVVLDSNEIGAGTTGHASNHLTTDIDFGYSNIKKKFSEKVMQQVAGSRLAAIDTIENTCRELDISCDFERTDGYLYADSAENVSEVEEELKYARRAGLDVEQVPAVDLPFPVKKAIRYNDQGIFNTQKYLNGLAKALQQKPECDIYCNSRVEEVDNSNKKVITKSGTVTAAHIILATHTPQFINILQTMVVPYRSYMIAVKLASGNYPHGLYWDCKEPYHYTRSYKQGDQQWLLIGGADHKTGHDGKDHYAQLEKYAREHYDVAEITDRWSAQYYEPADGLPYIGKSPLSNVYVATGYSGDGLVYGVVAAIIINALINGEEHEWLEAYNARRFTPVESAGKFVKHNLEVGKHYISGLIRSGEIKDVEAGEGKVINYKGNKYAVSRDISGKLTALSAFCTHMGCVIEWNKDEHTWDCPCHGSRFEPTGELIEGPATIDLESKGLE